LAGNRAMTATRFCTRCGKMVPERGLHSCVKAKAVTTQPKFTPVTTPAVTTKAAPSATTRRASGDKDRVYRWRAANRERYNAYICADGTRGAAMMLPMPKRPRMPRLIDHGLREITNPHLAVG
jgi:hypothetical protein